jgi:hypothetical protein
VHTAEPAVSPVGVETLSSSPRREDP